MADNFVLNVLSGGATRNVDLTNNLYDVQKYTKGAELGLQQQAGLISADEAAKALEEFDAKNEADRDKAVGEAYGAVVMNSAINVGAGVLSGIGAVRAINANKTINQTQKVINNAKATTAGSGKFTQKAATQATQYLDDIGKVSTVQNSTLVKTGEALSQYTLNGSNIGLRHVATKSGETALKVSLRDTMKNVGSNIGDVWKNIGSSTSFGNGVKNTLKAVGTTLKSGSDLATAVTVKMGRIGSTLQGKAALGSKIAGGIAAGTFNLTPALLAQAYTRSESNAIGAELQASIDTVTKAGKYYEDNIESLTEEQKAFYDAINKDRDAECNKLLDQYADYIGENGEFTNEAMGAKYAEAYAKLEKHYADQISEETKDWQGFAEYVTTGGVGNSMTSYMIDEGIDPDKVIEHSSFVEEKSKLECNQESFDKARKGYEITQDLNDSGLMGFIDSIHDTIIKHLPVFAYVEAGLKKGSDVLLETVLGDNYSEKYANQNIEDLADMICDDAKSDSEKRAKRDAYEKELEAGATVGVEAYQQYKDDLAKADEAKNTESEQPSGQQSGQEAVTDLSM